MVNLLFSLCQHHQHSHFHMSLLLKRRAGIIYGLDMIVAGRNLLQPLTIVRYLKYYDKKYSMAIIFY